MGVWPKKIQRKERPARGTPKVEVVLGLGQEQEPGVFKEKRNGVGLRVPHSTFNLFG